MIDQGVSQESEVEFSSSANSSIESTDSEHWSHSDELGSHVDSALKTKAMEFLNKRSEGIVKQLNKNQKKTGKVIEKQETDNEDTSASNESGSDSDQAVVEQVPETDAELGVRQDKAKIDKLKYKQALKEVKHKVLDKHMQKTIEDISRRSEELRQLQELDASHTDRNSTDRKRRLDKIRKRRAMLCKKEKELEKMKQRKILYTQQDQQQSSEQSSDDSSSDDEQVPTRNRPYQQSSDDPKVQTDMEPDQLQISHLENEIEKKDQYFCKLSKELKQMSHSIESAQDRLQKRRLQNLASKRRFKLKKTAEQLDQQKEQLGQLLAQKGLAQGANQQKRTRLQ